MWPPDDPAAFWTWSCERYARPGVAEACLALQDGRGLQVNLLLLACWLAERGRAVSPEQAGRIVDAASAWQDAVVRPLRETRRRLKGLQARAAGARQEDIAALRRAVSAEELAAERIEQLQLQRLAGECPPDPREPETLAQDNMALLLPIAGNSPYLPAVVSSVLRTSRICQS